MKVTNLCFSRTGRMAMAKGCGSADAGKTIGVGFSSVSLLLVIFLVGGWQFGASSRGDEKSMKKGSKSSAKSKSAAKVIEEKEPADESDLETDEDLTALTVPPGLLGTTKSMDRMKFSQELRGLLTEGMGLDGESQGAAKRHFEAS